MICKSSYRSFATGVLDKDVFGLQTLQHLMRMTRTWDSTMSMIPKGGDIIWGDLDWSPEGYYNCSAKKLKNNGTHTPGQIGKGNTSSKAEVNYGRIISFGKHVAEVHSSEIERIDFRVTFSSQDNYYEVESFPLEMKINSLGHAIFI